jgi:transposase
MGRAARVAPSSCSTSSVPGLARREPEKKLAAQAPAVLALLEQWQAEADKAGHRIARICVAYEAGRDGFWLARWLRERSIECHVIHPTSIPVSREPRRAKSDRLDLGLLQRSFLGWLRGEKKHCSMAPIPSPEEEDARRLNRERQKLTGESSRLINRMKGCLARLGIRNFNVKLRSATAQLDELHTGEGTPLPPLTRAELHRDLARFALVQAQLREVDQARREQLRQGPADYQRRVRALRQAHGLGAATADMLSVEIFSRPLRDRRAVARYAGLTGAPDESGRRRHEQGLARAGNARVRHGMIQLAWRFLIFQPESDLARWYRLQTANGRRDIRKTMIVALARKLLITLWQLATTGDVPADLRLRRWSEPTRAFFDTAPASACRSRSEMAVSRPHPWPQCRWYRMGPPLGALPPMRMTASWSGSSSIRRIQGCCGRRRGAKASSSPIVCGKPNRELRAAPPRNMLPTPRAWAPCSPPSRPLHAAYRRRPTASLDRGCARRHQKHRSGRRNGPSGRTQKLSHCLEHET